MTQQLRAEYARVLRQLIDGQKDELGELLTPIAEYLEEGDGLEDVIAEYQRRVLGAATWEEAVALSDKFSGACRAGVPIPAWALVVRALVAKVHLLRANMGYKD